MSVERSPAAGTSRAVIPPPAQATQDLVLLKRLRGIIKASCTRTETFINSVRELTAEARAQLEERRVRLDTYWNDYCDVQTQVEMIDEEEVRDRIAFEDAFYALCAKFRQLLQPVNSYASAQTSSSTQGTNTDTGSTSHVRLPKLNLPTFSGKYDEWLSFHDTFMTVIHSNKSLGNVQKFQYLRASLTDKAADIIKSLEISDNNYDLAWNLLKERYDNKQVIVQTHVKAILDLPAMTKENANDLRQIADGVSIHIRALTTLECHADKWDALLIYILNSKLDSITSREWHTSLKGTKLPTLKEFIEFLTHRSQVLEESVKRNSMLSGRPDSRAQAQLGTRRQALHATAERGKCNYCGGSHLIYFCKNFLALSIEQRIAEMRGRKICLNCLRASNHTAAKCSSDGCRTCNSKHNTLLHIPRDRGEAGGADDSLPASTGSSATSGGQVAIVTHSAIRHKDADILLSTALIYVLDIDGSRRTCRVLLDSGSQANFISSKCLRSLRLKTRSTNISISGIDSGKKRELFRLPSGIELADPGFNIASDIDMLIGAELFWQLLCVGQIRATAEHPTLQKTRLGWVLAGRADAGISQSGSRLRALHVSVNNLQLHEQVNRFWQIEELAESSNSYTKDEQTYEYLTLGHMRRVPAHAVEGEAVYLPHHGVFKETSQSAKLRVVFDASCKTSTGISLNDTLMAGPTIQQDLVSILTRFRTFAYVFTADIIKMYRQILIDESQTHLQRILWRDDSNSPVDTYELLIVTYGTSSAPFLAIRCLQHLARKHASEYPMGSKCILRNFYVDDLLTGASNLIEARCIRDEIIKILQRGQFELSKWSSNHGELLRGIENATNAEISLNKESGSRILGIIWDPSNDNFRFEYDCGTPVDRITKRTILSEIASLFDPLGLLGPLTVVAKIILQDAWQSQCEWDEALPQDIHHRWSNLKQQLLHLNELRIPRFVGLESGARDIQLHGFCDASERAYGACVYVRTGNSD
ncbi:PREDICTED: uncharacterized protein LOC105462820 [Wasmannia auropunctata]|uniref:uncharacterized protein LOC105462820 n=1 Tax=Wasmannia auropunctata TaxID=64793 RepID=UPI0005EF138C|nr:PREDICTED: uncharacterized protein LOC105462820 [Wasmannia auropunctata]